MSDSGSFVGGQPVVYTVVLSNSGTIQNDNPSNEFIVTLPASLTLVSSTATSGTPSVNVLTRTAAWSGSIAASGSVTITINATVIPTAPGTVINAQGNVLFDADVNGTNETLVVTNDPATPAPNDATSFTTVARSSVSGTMSVAGILTGSSNIIYTVVLTNTGPLALNDNPSNEFTTPLPASLTLVSSTATSGTPSVNVMTRTATWSGSIAAGGTVTITINATINPAAPGTVISAQGTVLFDRDGDNTNEALRMTDDPGTGAPDDATAITLVAGTDVTGTMTVAGIPTGSSNITYTVVLTNNGPLALNDNPSNEFIVPLPDTLTLVSCTANAGAPFANTDNNSASWSGSIPVDGTITITINATIEPAAPGTVIDAQGTVLFDRNGDHNNETIRLTDDPGTGPAPDATAITLVAGTDVIGVMTVSGVFAVGREVIYAVRLKNYGPLALNDNPSNEFIVELPSSLTLVSCTANTGDALADTGDNKASWSGPIPVDGVVEIAITATIDSVPVGTVIGSQGAVLFDRNGDHTNEAIRVTDNPDTLAPDDATLFTVDIFLIDGFEG